MTFLQPALLLALPLAALPVVIHLIHLYRRRQVKWAAMMFLRTAQRMNKGFSRLRQIFILALRVLAVLAILLVITRPLAGGWLGLTGGAPDTVLILLDRSASMEQQNPSTGLSKRKAGLQNLSKAINDAVGNRSRLVLIDSALGTALPVDNAAALLNLPQTEGTDSGADIPALLQAALDFISRNKSGRTDVWLLSDFQQSDWDATSGRWEALRSAFATLPAVRFHLLGYPEATKEDLAISVERVSRRETADKAELLFDLRVVRTGEGSAPQEVPLRLTINGTTTTQKVELKENQAVVQSLAVPLDQKLKRGWGRVELPADASPANNAYHFVFDEPPVLKSVIISDDEAVVAPLKAALSAPMDGSRKYSSQVLSAARAAEIPWDECAMIIWHAAIPKAGEVLAQQLHDYVAAGRCLIFLPTQTPDGTDFMGLGWEKWEGDGKAQNVEWWRNDSDLLANTRDGVALPVGSLEVVRRCVIRGEGVALARIGPSGNLLVRAAPDLQKGAKEAASKGNVYFLGALPGGGDSSLGRDGVVLFALLHRALNEGSRSLGKTQQRAASSLALGGDASVWQPVEQKAGDVRPVNLALKAGVVTAGDQMVALNRPLTEDSAKALSSVTLSELFAGLDFRVLTDTLEDGRSLTNEIWRTFLMLMGLALLGEALLCLPPRRETKSA